MGPRMTRKLRSNFDEGSSRWAVRRAQWRALGLTDEDMQKPKIAVVNSSSELSICFSHLDGVAAAVKDAVRAAGGLPFEIRTMAPSDFIHSAGRAATYLLPSRDLITNDIEAGVEGAQLDGMVVLTSCDKTGPGQLMAAARIDIPTIVVICGYQPSGTYNNHHVDIEEVFLGAGHHLSGKLSFDDLKGMSEVAIRGPGVCSGMGTANSVHVMCEALGMTLPGAAPVLANSPRMFDYARRSGARIVDMVWEDLTPRKILGPAAFANAAAMVLAVSGSINCIKHLQAIATEAKTDVDVYGLFDKLGDRIPVLTAIRPMGDYPIEALEAAGGASAVLKQLESLLDTSPLTVTGKTLAENLKDAQVHNADAVRPIDRPFSAEAPIVMLRGSLAPDGAIIKLGLRTGRTLSFEGRARVFDVPQASVDAIINGGVKAGDVIVLRGVGVRGGPGMGGASRTVFALDGMPFAKDVAVVTDGQLSGLVNVGLVVGEVTPESAVGGPLALVEDGDTIVIDVNRKAVDLAVPEAELAARRARLKPAPMPTDSGWLTLYGRNVGPLAKGATLAGDR
jgi:dihydroxy-acid dehydratase